MKIEDWITFYKSLVIDEGYGTAVEKPQNDALDQFEKKHGFKLPQSYREFIKLFGPGEFLVSLKISSPGYDPNELQGKTFELSYASENYGYDHETAKLAGITEMDILSRLFYFGRENEDNWLGWDLEDVRDSSNFEYATYRVGSEGMEFVSPTFKETVALICGEIFATPDWDEEELGPLRVFHPAVYKIAVE